MELCLLGWGVHEHHLQAETMFWWKTSGWGLSESSPAHSLHCQLLPGFLWGIRHLRSMGAPGLPVHSSFYQVFPSFYHDRGSPLLLRQLQIGTSHLPLQGLNQVLLQLLIFNSPWKEFRVESRNAAFCSRVRRGSPNSSYLLLLSHSVMSNSLQPHGL